MKKLLAMALAMCMTLSLASCATKSDGSGSASTPDASKGDKDAFPAQQINLIIQAAAGGESDNTGRLIAQTMEQELGVPVVCQNKPGAAGAVAFQYVRQQKADGYTIGICPAEIAMVEPLGMSDVNPTDMDFIGGACETPSAIIVRADAPYDNLDEFVEYCKAHPGEVRNATSGAGSTMHIGSEIFARATGIEFNYTPFDGSGPAFTAIMGNHADVGVIGVLAAAAGVDSGDLKILGILGKDRSPVYPDVPTAIEQGYDVEYYTWVGLYAPKGLDADVLATLEAAVKAGVEGAPYVDFTDKKGLTRKYRNASEFTEFVMSQYDMYKELIPSLNIA